MRLLASVVLMAFVSNCMGDSSWEVRRFDSAENCEEARVVYQRLIPSRWEGTRNYECIKGVKNDH